MDPKEFVRSMVRAANSDAADNKPKCGADTEQSYCANVTFSRRHDLRRESEREKKEF
jgi:hypothetical protein